MPIFVPGNKHKITKIMARPKKQVKAKEPVTIRFKSLAKGSKSIYLDIYRDGVRSYEFLKLYLIPERPGVEADKTANQITLDAANAIKAQRIKDILNGEAGIKDRKGENVLLLDWMQTQETQHAQAAKDAGHDARAAENYHTTRLHLARYIESAYKGRVITLAAVDKDFCAGFVQYLKGAKKTRTTKNGLVEHKSGGKLSANTCNMYYSKLAAALNAAYKRELIPNNPATLLEDNQRAKMQQTERAYLTAEELNTLNAAYCGNEQVKAAFLFSCMCGLRWSDIKALTWEKVNTGAETWQVETRMLKTQKVLYLPISPEARKFMPAREDKGPQDLVFSLPSFNSTNKAVKAWVKRAGIAKDITFHCARHTFATLMLTLGADLYTTSKLLGHSDIKVTQIYAAIIDKKKQDAVNLTSGLFTL